MSSEPLSPATLVFGPFEVNATTGELRRRGVRVRLSGQPVEVLLVLLASPANLVTREQLHERLWSNGTFVDFEHGLNAAINKLRRALDDSADQPRYIETVPGRGYRFIGRLEPASNGNRAGAETHEKPLLEGAAAGRVPRLASRRALTVAAALGVAGVFGAVWLFSGLPGTEPPWTLARLTADAGIADYPGLSPDGQLVAYSSDLGKNADRGALAGTLDLYVKHIGGGSAIRLTFDGAGNTMPAFSPDGSRIVFRSNRDGGGIYEMPALGGDARLIVRGGHDPQYSPDGTQVAYWVGPESVSSAVPGSGAVWVTPANGGQPQRIAPQLTTARYPVWHEREGHLLLLGYSAKRAFNASSIDWWVVSPDRQEVIRTGAYDAFVRAGLQPLGEAGTPVPEMPAPRCWSSADDTVTFSIRTGDSWNLWEIGISPRTGKVTGLPRRLTTGTDGDVHASCASNGAIAFAKVDRRMDIWRLPFDLDRGSWTGEPTRVTDEPLRHYSPSLADDGKVVAFASERLGRQNIWLRELVTGKESSVAASQFAQGFPVLNASGTRVAYSVYEKDKRVLYVAVPGGAPEKICEGCLRATDWSRDERSVLVFVGDPYQINRLDLATHQQIAMVKHPAYHLLYGRFSPDNDWISFTARIQPDRGRILIAPTNGPTPVPESAWVTIADVNPDDYAFWSPHGDTLYFSSSRDGYACLWGQRLDPISRQPAGEPFAAQHLHGRLSFNHDGWSAAAGGFAIPLRELTGNLWMMSRSARP